MAAEKLTAGQVPLLAKLCPEFDVLQQHDTWLAENPDKWIVENSTGTPIKHPRWVLRQTAFQNFRSLGTRYGLTPKDLEQLTAPVGAPPASPLEQFAAKKECRSNPPN